MSLKLLILLKYIKYIITDNIAHIIYIEILLRIVLLGEMIYHLF